MSNPLPNKSVEEINSNFDVPVVMASHIDNVESSDIESNDIESNDIESNNIESNNIELNDTGLKGSVEHTNKQQTDHNAAEIVLERTSQHPPRITSLCRLQKGQSLSLHRNTGSIEALVLSGTCNNKQALYQRGSYLRFPVGVELHSKEGCLLFVKQNQFLDGDDGQRHISIYDNQNWMPGPTEEMLLKPLHVFGSESIMVLRWKQACEFRPYLNPNGEEILVLDGLLQNRDHLYRPMSWIRNPVPDWRDWHGSTDTYLYYKSGHFPKRR